MNYELEDLCVVITGASGGIGRALAREFASAGARLCLLGHSRADELQAFVERTGLPAETLCLACDVRDPEQLERAFAAAAERFERVDCAIANAGVWPAGEQRLDELSPERVRGTIEVNLLGAMWTFRAFMGQLARSGPRSDGRAASAIAIGSTAGHFGERHHADYAAAKAGLGGLVQSLKNELPALDPFARINLIEPGWTATEMARPALEDPEAVRGALRTMALRQIGGARDIAAAALYFASPNLARHVTGQTLTVAGGMEGRVLWNPDEIDPGLARQRART